MGVAVDGGLYQVSKGVWPHALLACITPYALMLQGYTPLLLLLVLLLLLLLLLHQTLDHLLLLLQHSHQLSLPRVVLLLLLLVVILLLLLLQQLHCHALLLQKHWQQVSLNLLWVVGWWLLSAKGLLLIRVPEPPVMVPLQGGECSAEGTHVSSGLLLSVLVQNAISPWQQRGVKLQC